MTDELLHSNRPEEITKISVELLEELTTETEKIPRVFADTTDAIKGELEAVTAAIETWEKIAPRLYHIKKRLLICDELLSGKRDVDSISAMKSTEDKPEKKKRGPQSV